MARPFAAPPGMPADRKAALIAAFEQTMKDPDFLAEAQDASAGRQPGRAPQDRRLAGRALCNAEGRHRQGRQGDDGGMHPTRSHDEWTWHAIADRIARIPASRTMPCCAGAGASSTTSWCRACCMRLSCAARIPHALDPRASIEDRRAGAAGRARRAHARRSRAGDGAAAHDAALQFRHAARPVWAFALADGEVSYVGEAGRDRGRRQPLCRRGRRRPGRGRLRGAAGGRRLPQGGAARCAGGAARAQLQCHRLLQGRLRRRRGARSARPRMCCTRISGSIAAPAIRSRAAASWPSIRGADDSLTVWASTQKAHDLLQSLTSLLDFDESAPAGGDARRRRRLRSEALRLFGGCRGGGGGEAAQALDQMDRGPARAFHQCGAGARPVLVDRHRGRCGRQGARHSRPPDPRSRRLCAAGRQHALQLGLDDERPVYRAGARHGGRRSPPPTRRRCPRCAAPAIRRPRSRWSG